MPVRTSNVDRIFPSGRGLISGFESTLLPHYGADCFDTTGHSERWRSDLDHTSQAGVRMVRYPLRWHRIETEPGCFDWRETDRVLGHIRRNGLLPIVDLVHHTSYPCWLADGFRDRRFGPAYQRFAEAVITRYPWIQAYTLFNEPFATLFLAGHEALWPPYDRGNEGFVRLLSSVLPALSKVGRCWSELAPDAAHVWVDTAENHRGIDSGQDHAALANDRRHIVFDLMTRQYLDDERPYLQELQRAGGEHLLDLEPIRVDVLGLDYYSHSEWMYTDEGAQAPSGFPIGFAAVAEYYGRRYQLPLMLTETNVRGLPTDRTSWLRHMLEQYELATTRGVDLRGFCWFPGVDSCDWDSLLARAAGRTDPVGVVSLGADGERQPSVFTDAWRAVAAGAPAESLPAYRFQAPCDTQLAGFAPLMTHWPWQEPEGADRVDPVEVSLAVLAVSPQPARSPQPAQSIHPAKSAKPAQPAESPEVHVRSQSSSGKSEPDLIVLSHLRWPWVWQRPQQVISRLTGLRGDSRRTWFVEEPVGGLVERPKLQIEELDGITRVFLILPGGQQEQQFTGFDAPAAGGYGDLLAALLAERGASPAPDVWLYTPMALDIAHRLSPGRVIYDVMDDLAAFKSAPQGLILRQRRLLAEASVVFTGGRSLHRSVLTQRQEGVHLFASGVDTQHYAAARSLRKAADESGARQRHVAGYVGVFDERIDTQLLQELAANLPDWTIRIVGPIAKIADADVPRADNIEYLGFTDYDRLPAVMAGFDVALMPFALNDATRSISPTKTLEYLAAGLPVVSTRVADVVADYSSVVHFADDGASFARACQEVLAHRASDRDRRVRPLQAQQEWDYIALSMAAVLDQDESSRAATSAGREESA